MVHPLQLRLAIPHLSDTSPPPDLLASVQQHNSNPVVPHQSRGVHLAPAPPTAPSPPPAADGDRSQSSKPTTAGDKREDVDLWSTAALQGVSVGELPPTSSRSAGDGNAGDAAPIAALDCGCVNPCGPDPRWLRRWRRHTWEGTYWQAVERGAAPRVPPAVQHAVQGAEHVRLREAHPHVVFDLEYGRLYEAGVGVPRQVLSQTRAAQLVLLGCTGVPSPLLRWDASARRFTQCDRSRHPRLAATSRAALQRVVAVAREVGTHFRRLDALVRHFGSSAAHGGQVCGCVCVCVCVCVAVCVCVGVCVGVCGCMWVRVWLRTRVQCMCALRYLTTLLAPSTDRASFCAGAGRVLTRP